MVNLNELKENLIKKGYETKVFNNSKEAKEYLLNSIKDTTVGIGGSVSVEQLNIYDDLKKNNTVYWNMIEEKDKQVEVRDLAMNTKIYLTSANAISMDGEIVNIDGTGNRVASTLYGHEKIYFIIGRNKIENTLDEAINRARNIAAPLNAKRLNKKTPCVMDLKCHNCSSPERICRSLVVLYQKSKGADYEVILIDEDLGY